METEWRGVGGELTPEGAPFGIFSRRELEPFACATCPERFSSAKAQAIHRSQVHRKKARRRKAA